MSSALFQTGERFFVCRGGLQGEKFLSMNQIQSGKSGRDITEKRFEEAAATTGTNPFSSSSLEGWRSRAGSHL